MHVCDVDNFYSPRGGGVKTYHEQKIRFFLRHPEHSYTLVHASAVERREQLSARVQVVGVPGVRMTADYHFMLNAIRLRQELERLRPDVVELGEPYLLPWVARVASIGRPWQLVGFWHADFPRAYAERPLSRVHPWAGRIAGEVAWWYARRTYGPLAAVFASTKATAANLRQRGFAPVYQTPLAVDTRVFNPARRDRGLRHSQGITDSTALLIFPHRLTEEKGLTPVLQAFVEMSKERDVALVLAGTGPGEALVREYGAAHPGIHYLGYVDDPRLMAAWYASSEAVFSLCPFETFGLATLEAAACGCAILGTSRGAVGELVARSGAGVHVSADRPGAIAAAGVALLRDSTRLAECRARGPVYVEREYSWDRTFSRMLDCYQRVLAASAAS